jgi:hypothetical protein
MAMAMAATEVLVESHAGPPLAGIGTYATSWCLPVCALNPRQYAALLVVVMVVVVVVVEAAVAARKVMIMMMKEQQQVPVPVPVPGLEPSRSLLLVLLHSRHAHEPQLRLHRKQIRHPRHHFRHHHLGEEWAVLRQSQSQTTTDRLSIKGPRGDILKGGCPRQ